MAQLNLDAAKIEESLGPLEAVANTSVVDLCNDLAAVLTPHAGENELMDELLEQCKKATLNYNDNFLPGLTATIEEFKTVIDVSEYLAKKASVGDVKNEDTGFKTEKIDASKVMI